MGPLLSVLFALLTPAPGRLVVRSGHYGALVLVDREPVGRIPLGPVPLAPGLHLVEATAPGRPRWSRLVFVPAGETLGVNLRWVGPPSAATRQRPGTTPPPPPPPPPVVRLTASSELAAAALGAQTDVDLRFGWRLWGERLAGGPWQGAVAGRALNDLAGDARLWRRVQPANDTALRLDEAWLGGRWTAADFSVGRVAREGPGGAAYLLDGAQARAEEGLVRLELAGGRRAIQWGPSPAHPWLAAGALSWQVRDQRLTWASVLHDRIAHHDLTGDGRLAALRWRARGRLVGGAVAGADGGLRWIGEAASVWIHGGLEAARAGPFEWRLLAPDLFAEVPRRSGFGRFGLSWLPGHWRLEALGGIRAATDGGWRQHDGSLSLDWAPPGGWRLGLAGRARLSGGEGPAAYHALQPTARLGRRGGALEGELEGGGSWIRPPGPPEGRWLPHLAADGRWWLAAGLALRLRLGARAVHPAWYPEGDRLLEAVLGVELR